jgi:hypothetical protein
MLATKMVKEGFGVAGSAIDIGAANHVLAACSEEFTAAFNPYFANDMGRFSSPHPAALDRQNHQEIVRVFCGDAGRKGPYRID